VKPLPGPGTLSDSGAVQTSFGYSRKGEKRYAFT
jgi:hypothetical protein